MAPLCNEESSSALYTEDDSSSSTTMRSSASSLLSTSVEISSAPMLPKGGRSVKFSAGTAVHIGAVINIGDYSEAEKFDCWFQPDEMREIRREVKETVALMNRNISINEIAYETISTHGLEGKTRAGKRDRKKTRLASLAAVFDEQALQEMDGICDPNLIAMAYAECSYPMQVAAFERASQHEKATLDFYKNDNTSYYRSKSSLENSLTSKDISEFVDISLVEEPKENKSSKSSLEESRSNGQILDNPMVDTNDTSSFVSNDQVTSFRSTEPETKINRDKIDSVENFDSQFNIGSFKIRNRFAWLAFQ